MKPFATRALLLSFGLALAAGSAELPVRIAAAMSPEVKYLATARGWQVSSVPILLQKSFCTADQNIFWAVRATFV
jgi:hypothetical protein